MVTKRARTWFARGTLIAALVVVGVLGASTWMLSGVLIGDLLDAPPGEETTAIVEVRHSEIVLARTDRLAAPGRWAVASSTGFADLGEVLAADETTVTRRILRRDGVLASGMVVTVTRATFGADPRARGLRFSEVLIEGPDGDLPVWAIPGIGATWIVYVPDTGFSRAEALRVAGVASRLGFPIVVGGRTGEGVATDPEDADDLGEVPLAGGDLGSDRWREVEAVIRHALSVGAADVVIVGSGTGASAALLTARESRFASRIIGLVLDGALLDPATVADRRLEADKAPGFLIGWAKAAVTFRRGIDWNALDHIQVASQQVLPVLLFHGDRDDRFPIEDVRRYADLAGDARLVEVAGAGHGEAWNLDPLGYERALEQFLRDLAAESGGSGDTTQG